MNRNKRLKSSHKSKAKQEILKKKSINVLNQITEKIIYTLQKLLHDRESSYIILLTIQKQNKTI